MVNLFAGTDSCATLVPIGALRWYRFLRYSGTDSCAMMVPFRRYYHLFDISSWKGGLESVM